MMQLDSRYNRNDFLRFLEENFFPDFRKDIRPASTEGLTSLQKAYSLGSSESLDLQVFEFSFEGSPNKRVTLTKEAFQIMRSHAIFQALAIFYSPSSDDWRLSLMTATPERTEKGKVALSYSNPKRLSFFLGPNAKINTPTKFILKKGNVIDFEDLKSRFSIEVVNKEFYTEISGLFTQLVGGSVYKGKKKEDYEALLKLPSIQDKSQTSLEFAVRLIGRVIFCWFLREKKSNQGKSLMPNDLLSLEAVKNNSDYYHKILEPIFFEILNKLVKSRKDDYAKEPFSSIPYLNGGLFSPHDDDFFSYNEGKQAINHNTVVIPDKWLLKFFAVLETYNFTIDENTSFDEELSIDPEMLGRIFENLLAEINPETGESARKSTGSYYTPRVIVDYMVDESLLLYLKNQTQIDEQKIRTVISYNLNNDEENPLSENEKERIINALEKVKILDPACGSGAFPIGALQKIVFILQQADPEGKLWFKKQIKNTSPEIRRVIEREFAHKNFDYIRKLGIIRENIYGVDIQPIATEISRLRCFLTLVVDERIKEELENRGIEPLPNLDFKFVTANSLIRLPGSQANSQIGLFEDDAGIRELKELRDMFFNASGAERDQLKLQFVQAQNRMFQRLISDGRSGHAELTTKLTTWDPFGHKASMWFDPEWMFGVKNWFDILIANPPYVFSRENLTNKQKQLFKEQFTLTQFKLNLYVLFIEKSFNLLISDGIFSFILPNNWLTLSTASKLRHFILTNTFNTKLVLHYEQVFETASVDTCLLIFKKSGEKVISFYSWDINGIRLMSQHEPEYFLKNNGYLLSNIDTTSDINQDILKKINGKSEKLDCVCEVRNGVQAYTVGEGDPKQTKDIKNNRAYHSKIKHDDNWKKYLDGADVERYKIKWSGQFIKYGNNLSRPRQSYLFQGERILVRQIPALPPYCIVASICTEQAVVDNNCLIVRIKDASFDIKYILSIINSKLISYWFIYTFGKLQRKTFPQFKVNELRLFPIRRIDSASQQSFINAAENILELTRSGDYLQNPIKRAQAKDYEKQIDQMVYNLYGLTPEEIALVEKS